MRQASAVGVAFVRYPEATLSVFSNDLRLRPPSQLLYLPHAAALDSLRDDTPDSLLSKEPGSVLLSGIVAGLKYPLRYAAYELLRSHPLPRYVRMKQRPHPG